jgi:lipopolysaccharide/colanic/teichoic acid biosynthesis glycosyltransferase
MYRDFLAAGREGLQHVAYWTNGRNGVSWDDRFRLDVWYVEHASLPLDLKILAATVGLVLRRHGISQPGRATMERFRGND